MTRKQRKKREALRGRKAEIHIKLCGLRFELAEWNTAAMKRLTEIRGMEAPAVTARKIGELEAERNLIDLYLAWED